MRDLNFGPKKCRTFEHVCFSFGQPLSPIIFVYKNTHIYIYHTTTKFPEIHFKVIFDATALNPINPQIAHRVKLNCGS